MATNQSHEQILTDITALRAQLLEALKNADTLDSVEAIRVQFLGRKGLLASLMDTFKTISLEDKRILGPHLQELRPFIETSIKERADVITQLLQHAALNKERFFDVTAKKYIPYNGSLHVYTLMVQELEDIFTSMGFAVADGPEVESEYFNFTALNIAQNHPARDAHDTLWLADFPNMLMRTHTSTVQIHAMKERELPLAIFAPGRTFRNEATDASHDFMFMQGECLFIDKNASMAQLLYIAQTFLQALFNTKNIKIRVRPGYFPFVEPGVEIDASCPFCTQGCSICKKSGWIELLGAGLVHPNVLQQAGIDSNIYRGFAMGFGISRIAMLKYGIHDVRLLHSNKIAILKQFNAVV